MSFAIRSADVSADAHAVARLLSFVESEPVTAEIVWDRLRKLPPDAIQCQLLAVNAVGDAVGLATACHLPYKPSGHFALDIIVDSDWRGQGVGTALYDRMVMWLRDQGATSLGVSVRDDCPVCLSFAVQRGFEVESHQYKAVLDLAAFDATPFAGTIDAMRAAGMRFFSLAETDGSEAMQRKLYDLNTATGLDIPGNAGGPVRPFEQFARDVFGGYWFRPEGQIFAAECDQWVGMAAVGEIAPGAMYNMHTGVLHEYRGRGIAQALKLLAIEFSRRQGARSIRTNNDSRNAPMIAINQKLGYRPEPGWYRMRLPTLD